jgi:hypothetical protein
VDAACEDDDVCCVVDKVAKLVEVITTEPGEASPPPPHDAMTRDRTTALPTRRIAHLPAFIELLTDISRLRTDA